MRTPTLFHASRLVAMASLVSCLQAETVKMRDAATHQQLSLAMQKTAHEDPMKSLKTAVGADPSVVNRPKSIIAESDIVCFGGHATLVPKRAILVIPKNYADRIHFQTGAMLKGWSEFYANNRGWITTIEVSRLQAEGKDPIAAEIETKMVKSGNLVVATYLGGPISVLPLKVPEIPNAKQP